MHSHRPLAAAVTEVLRRLRLAGRSGAARSRQLGQVLPFFALLAVVLLAGSALITDVAWWWTNEQRMQRAADAAALAGAIYLPGNQALAFSAAISEAHKNGYTDGADGVVVNPRRDPNDPRKLIVDIDGSVETNFARALCVQGGPCLRSVDIDVTGAASYVLPVPMGSPQNYYGLGFLVDASTSTSAGATNWLPARSTKVTLSAQWNGHNNVYVDDGSRAATSTNGAVQNWGDFNISLPSGATATGIEVRLNSSIATAGTECRFSVDLYNGGSYTTVGRQTPDLTTSNPAGGSVDTDHDVGSSTDMWGHQDWTASELGNTNFRVRVTYDRPASCGATGRIDLLAVRVHYTRTTTTIAEMPVRDPVTGAVLAPQGFWGALQSQGAPNIQGDAYMTYYDTRVSVLNEDYRPTGYYQYAIELPPSASAGEVWLFDPGFCHVDSDKGTGEYYTLGGANGSSSFNRVSTFYELWDTRNTLYDTSDDGDLSGTRNPIYSSGEAYRRTRWHDTLLDAVSPVTADPCDGLEWHNDWVRIASGLPGGRTYRLHTYSTDPNLDGDQRDTTALNAFAIYANASGGTPRVHGLGAMEAYVRLPGGQASEFYLAQIDAEHAGKTLVISLWDPGDTGALAADLQILRPTNDDYEVTAFSWAAKRNSGAAANCGPNDEFGDFPQDDRDQTDVTSVRTNEGGRSNFNGCWLQIEIPLDTDYSAPNPSSDTVTDEGGWWKIRYNMSGSTSDYSTDLTTWEVKVRGNPVHLVQE